MACEHHQPPSATTMSVSLRRGSVSGSFAAPRVAGLPQTGMYHLSAPHVR
jgi:hypothetical protein